MPQLARAPLSRVSEKLSSDSDVASRKEEYERERNASCSVPLQGESISSFFRRDLNLNGRRTAAWSFRLLHVCALGISYTSVLTQGNPRA